MSENDAMLSNLKTRLLCVWEQGGNLGHLSNLRLPIEVALEQGFEVVLAARELHRVGEVLGGLPITLLQAPFKQAIAPADQAAFLSYTHLIGQQCFSSSVELEMYVRAWRGIFDLVQPHIVLFEHSPTALVASTGYAFKKILVGASFAVPPSEKLHASPFLPFPNTPQTDEVRSRLRQDDQCLLAVVNAALSKLQQPALQALGQIYSQADQQFLLTWPELDQFGERQAAHYLGVEPLQGAVTPQWPAGGGAKVFGYLQYFPAIEHFLRDIQAAKVCALLLVRGLPPAIRQKFASDQIRFVDELVTLPQVAEQAAWVVHHGNHSTMSTFLLTGTPQLLIPRHQEQLFGALRLVSQGCAAMAFQDQTAFAAAIHALQTNAQLRQNATQIASQCAPFDRDGVRATIRQTYSSFALSR
jgi:hypothetical protein